MKGNLIRHLRTVLCGCIFLSIALLSADDDVDQLTNAFDGAWGTVKDYAVNFGMALQNHFLANAYKIIVTTQLCFGMIRLGP